MQIDNLQELLVDEMRDILNAEGQLLKALPKMARKATSPRLRKAFEDHKQETEGHVERLKKAFGLIGKKATGKTCHAMEGLVEEGKEIMEEDMEDDARDAALIAAAQKVEHYEIATYGTLRTWAQLLDMKDVAKLLQQNLDEEGKADKLLTQLAESEINLEAADGEEQ